MIKDASSGAFRTRLVKVDRPLLRIPSLAVHLDSSVNSSFSFNRETQFVPILGLVSSESSRQQDDPAILSMFASDNHHAELLEAVADDLGVRAADIEELELALYGMTHRIALDRWLTRYRYPTCNTGRREERVCIQSSVG